MSALLSTGLFLLGTTFLPSYADLKCVEKLEDKKAELAQAQTDFDQGDKSVIELADAKLAANKQAWDCKLIAKYNYCKYQQDVMNFKIKQFNDDPSLESTTDSADLTQGKLDTLIDYCTHPAQL